MEKVWVLVVNNDIKDLYIQDNDNLDLSQKQEKWIDVSSQNNGYIYTNSSKPY